MERERFQNYVGNGDRVAPTFSDAEMQRRLDSIRGVMAANGIDAALFSSYHCSRYNTNTGVLTPKMFKQVFANVRAYLTKSGR